MSLSSSANALTQLPTHTKERIDRGSENLPLIDITSNDDSFSSYIQRQSITELEPMAIAIQNNRPAVNISNESVGLPQASSGDNPAFDLIGLTKLRNDPQFAGIDGSGFSVAVIDTGIDTNHPLIAPNYVAGYDFVDKDNQPLDPDGHGTHVSGTIGAIDETIGIAPDVGLIGLRVLDDRGAGSMEEIEDALKWVQDNRDRYNIIAVNLSLGVGFFTTESELPENIIADDIQRLEAAGVTIVSATGNDYFANSDSAERANIAFPGISSTIAVGAVWQDGTEHNASWDSGSIDYSTGTDRIASFSQRLNAPNVIFAPGAMITSTLPGGIGVDAGTSQAAPHVAGAVALLQEASLQFSGDLLTPAEVNEILRTTGDSIVDGDNEDDNVSNTTNSYHRLNIYNAVSEVKKRSDKIAPAPENNSDELDINIVSKKSNGNVGAFSSVTQADEIAVLAPGDRLLRDLDAYFYTPSVVEEDPILVSLLDYYPENSNGIAFYVEPIEVI